MGRCGRGHVPIVARLEQRRKIRQRPLPGRHVDHRADEKSHHMMKKPVCLDREDQTARPIAPTSHSHDTAMIVVLRRRAEYRERAEAMLAFHHRRREIELVSIQPLAYRELPRPSKW